MGLLSTLQLPESASRAAPQAAKPQTIVTLFNSSGFALKLEASGLNFDTARFVPGPPAVVPPQGKLAFRVVESTVGADKTVGWARYHLEDPRRKVTVTFFWRDDKGFVKIEGVGDFSSGARAKTDAAKGNEYMLVFKDAAKIDKDVVAKLESGTPEPVPPTRITIVNTSGYDLHSPQKHLSNDKSKFNPEPPAKIGAGRQGRFAVEAPDPQFPKTNGDVTYAFTIVSNDPDAADANLEMSFDWTESSRGSSVPNAAQGVRVETSGDQKDLVFTVIGPELEFKPPEQKVKQPTLRKGDKSADGWVEYLQELLNLHIGAGLEVDGDFKGETFKAVKAFQRKYKKEGVLEDGIVGDQTWSYLRQGAPEKPKTDGRKPHEYVEQGVEARWLREKEVVWYDDGVDTMFAQLISVGDITKIEGRRARFRIMNADGDTKTVDGEISKGFPYSKTGQGHQHDVPLEQFSTLFGAGANGKAKPGRYVVNAYFPGDLGGDAYTGVLTIAGPAG